QHRLAEPAAVEQVLQGPHRLVVAHVLVDGQLDAGGGAALDAVVGLADAQGQRLLGQDAAEVLALLRGGTQDGRLGVGRHGDVENLDLRVGEEVGDGGVDGRDAVAGGDLG